MPSILKIDENSGLLTSVAMYASALPQGKIQRGIEEILKVLVEHLGSSFAAIVLLKDERSSLSVEYSWAVSDKRAADNLFDKRETESIPWFTRQLLAHPYLSMPRLAGMPPEASTERLELDSHGIRSWAAVSLLDESREPLGFLYFGAEDEPRFEDIELKDVLVRIGKIITGLMLRDKVSQGVDDRIAALEEVNRASKERYSSIMESLAEGLVMADPNGHLTYCNERFAEITGYPKEEIIGRRVYELFFENATRDVSADIARMHERYKARRRGESEEYEMEITRPDGEVRWMQVRAAPLRDATGEIVGSIGMNTDITEQKHLETQLRWSQKMEAVGRLAGGVAHDFNNLLTVISGYSNIILKKISKDDPHHRQVEAIREASDAAYSLTQQLLAVSRRQVVQPKLLDLNDVVEHSTGIINGLIGDEIALSANLETELSQIKIDPGQIQQIIMNLAINARDAMPNGGTLRIETYEVTVEPGDMSFHPRLDAGKYVVFTMSDTGMGMSEKVQAHLFEPFFTTKKGGTGLGLSTIYGIIKQHGGTISVYSELGIGSTFTVYLPAAAERSVAQNDVEKEALSFHGSETILLVEDEAAVRELVKEVLEKSGYTVIEAVHGGKALEVVAERHAEIDAILTDVSMPHVSGFELAEKVLRHHPEIKILMMSGCTHDPSIPENIVKYDIPFLPKPFSPDVLSEKIREVIDGPSRQQLLQSRSN